MKAFDSDLSQAYADALDARRLPHVLVGSWSFRDRPEIDAMLSILTAIEWPEDDLSVYAALRGPLIALPDGLLLRYRSSAGRLHPFAPRSADISADLKPVADALDLLRGLCEGRNDRPFSETVHRILESTRAHVGLALRPAGRRALANVQRVADLARTFELQGGLSFRGFVEALENEAAQARGHEGPIDEPGTEGVRLMTVHSAKGLEFPVVILTDITAPSARTPYRHVDTRTGLAAVKLVGCAPRELRENASLERSRDQAESVRLAYVAATRARDLLVLNTIGLSMQTFFPREDYQSWIQPLEKVFYPRPILARSQPAPGVPRQGDATCLSSPPEHRSAMPGLHFLPRTDLRSSVGSSDARSGRPAAVWPAARALPGRRSGVDPSGDGRERYQGWRKAIGVALDAGNIASHVPLSASEAEVEPPDFEGFVDEIVLPIEAGRPSGIRFGALVHAVLKDVALDADRSMVTAVAKMHGRLLAATTDEVDATAQAVATALEHDIMVRARRAKTTASRMAYSVFDRRRRDARRCHRPRVFRGRAVGRRRLQNRPGACRAHRIVSSSDRVVRARPFGNNGLAGLRRYVSGLSSVARLKTMRRHRRRWCVR